MTKRPLISIVVPVYNVERYMERCFDAIKAQTYKNIEVIAVDDGSEDRSGSICDRYASEDERFIVVHQKNGGLSAARNTGIKRATGEYITFIDSDDSITEDYIEYLYNLIEKYEADISICAIEEITESEKTRNYGANYSEKKLTPEKCLERMLGDKGFNVSAYAKLYKTELFDGVLYPVGRIHEDLGTTYRPILKSTAVAYGSHPNYKYYLRNGSLAHSKYTDQKLDIIELTDQMCDAIDKQFESLKDVTNLRRMHARFAVLRMMPKKKQMTPEQKEKCSELINYIREHKEYVLKNPHAGKRDKAAYTSLSLGFTTFRRSWNLYQKIKY